MRSFTLIFQFILFGITFASVIPHLFSNFWITDIFSHFKLQYIILLLILLFTLPLFQIKNKAFPIVLIVFLLGWNSCFIIPLYLEDSRVDVASGENLTILSMNLLASNTNYSDALELIREKDPDVVVLLELSSQWEKEIQVLHPLYPFRQMYPQTNNFGIGMLSKMPMTFTVTDFGKGFPPSIFSKSRVKDKPVSILATHPFPPVNQERFKVRNDQLEEISQFSMQQNGNFILAGDLNTSSYSKHFQKILEKGDLKDSRKGFGIASSWPTDYYVIRTTLDHFLLKGNMEVVKRSTERSIGSDHLPIYLEVSF